MLLPDFIRESARSLESLYPSREASAIVQRLCEDMAGFPHLAHILYPDTAVPPETEAALRAAVARLAKAEPLQYVLGRETFCGREFKVDPSVLIPRPETGMLVLEASRHISPASRVLDLCTGSGCIAWTVALDHPSASVTAVDISREALALASSQFSGNSPVFICADILDPRFPETFPEGSFDIVLSNPPYIMEREKSQMRPNVLDYEPSIALFVPDSDPLLFYRAVRDAAARLLAPGGRGFLEINETLGEETASLFRAEPFGNVGILKDFAGKNRIVTFERI